MGHMTEKEMSKRRDLNKADVSLLLFFSFPLSSSPIVVNQGLIALGPCLSLSRASQNETSLIVW